jgi:O-antigen/teichoic acid export membrane protein
MSHVPNLLIRPGLSLTGIALVASGVTAPHLRPVWALVALVAATCVAAAAGMLLTVRWWPAFERDAVIDDSGRWVRAAIPMALTSTLYVVLLNIDVAMLGFLRTGAEVGCYRIALQCASLIVMMLVAVNAVVAPRYAELHAARDMRGLAATCRMSSLIGGIWAAIVYAGFLFTGPSGIRLLFGDGYDDAMLPMLVLGAGEVVNAAFGPVGLLLSMAGHEGDTLRGVGIAVIVKILLCAALIPILGTLGAALAAASGTIVWNVLLWLRVRDHWGGFGKAIPEAEGRRTTPETDGVSGVAA